MLRNLMLAEILAIGGTGCTSEVQTMDDSAHMEAELPKVEFGPAPVDLNPATDNDIDVDTPAPGDR